MLTVGVLTCEHMENPVGVSGAPRFSWQLESEGRNVFQARRQIQVAAEPEFAVPVWDSGVVDCGDSVLVPYKGSLLTPQTRYFWRVRVWDAGGRESSWSSTASFVTALEKGGWRAPFITAEAADCGESSAGTMVRREFSLRSGVQAVFLNATALGVYKLQLNGQRVGDYAMAPGWTEYGSRLLYQSYDVTELVQEGANAVGAMIGAGWYKGDLAGWLNRRNVYGDRTAFSMQMTVRYQDGSTESICTGPEWAAWDGPVRYSEIYNGETYDARREVPGWDTPGFDASGWRIVETIDVDSKTICPQDGPPVRPREVFAPVEMFTAPNGERILDFGQNLTGWIRLRVKGQAGDVVCYSHAEILDKDGNFYTGNLRGAKQQIHYTLQGGEEERYEPFFTFQGFRYLRVDSFPGEPAAESFEAVVAHSDMPETGSFHCSHQKLNQLEKNIRWGMKGNFLDIPTDCPQRDERMGWTGDAQVFVRAACCLHDTAAFFRKWLRDVAAAQKPNGAVPFVVPDILTGYFPEPGTDALNTTAGWGDAAVICPWTVYQYSGDRAILEEQYPSMKGWVEFIRSRAQWGLLWNGDQQLGDWVALDAKEGSYHGATPTDLVATAYYAYSTELLAKTARLLGKEEEAGEYFQLRESIGEAFVREFFTPTGRLCARTQTGHILALHFGLVPAEFRQRTIDTLVEILAEYENHLSTGFLGTPYICYALSENGRLDLAYELLLKEDYPSWLYPLSKGATTIWEHWDGMKPDGSMWSDNMNSFNHYAYGAVADWMYSVVGGLDSVAAGYRESRVAPRPGGGITSARVAEKTPYGALVADWRLEGQRMVLEVTVPHNTEASIVLPMGAITQSDGLAFVFDGQGQAARTGSGQYHFEIENVNTGEFPPDSSAV